MSGDEGSGGLAPSPYVHGKYNGRYRYGKRQGNRSGRHRPQTKALRVAKWQALAYDVPSLAAQGASAAGPPQARLPLACSCAIACLQVVVSVGVSRSRPA